MSFLPASQVQPQPIQWLWPGRLALGKLSLLEGDPELGKTWVTCDLAARLSVGQLFPDGQPPPGPAATVLLNGEDGAADTLRPRLEMLGADLDRVIVPMPRDNDAPLTLPSEVVRLESILANHAARLLVIDPWIAFLDPGVILSADASVRKALRPLESMARRRRCAILLVRHLTKKGGERALYRGAGSIGLVAACRTAWLIARSPLDDVCVFAQLKNNLAPRQPSLAYEFRSQGSEDGSQGSGERSHPAEERGRQPMLPSPLWGEGSGVRGSPPIEAQKSKIEIASFRWLGPTFWTAEELTGGRLTRAGRRAQARAFLREALQAGPRPVPELKAAAKDAAIAWRTAERASQELQVTTRRVVFPGCRAVNYWLLPGQQLSATIPERCVVPD